MIERPSSLVFFLGGHDLEMETIAHLVRSECGDKALYDAGLAWGARVEDYREEIDTVRRAGATPVLIELGGAAEIEGSIDIDHHGQRADEPTALEQVFALLDLPEDRWTRYYALVAANDRGHLRAMSDIGASVEEMVHIRRMDRAAQGVTAAQEREGVEALLQGAVAQNGGLLIVELPHGRMATVTDPLRLRELERGEDPVDLLVLSPEEVGFFGSGCSIAKLQQCLEKGWSGGDLPESGFWGISKRNLPANIDITTLLIGNDHINDYFYHKIN